MKKHKENAKMENIPLTTNDGLIIEKITNVSLSPKKKKTKKNEQREYRKIRNWKTISTERFSSIKKGPQMNSSWKYKMKQKEQRINMKTMSDQIKENKKIEMEFKRKKILLKKKLKLEKERNAEITVNVSNPKKLKKLRKKMLRIK
ncbi:hypothetical protein A3Q56_01600 [Intoshia linei]|uniref:Coiled-coil domain-containing protein 86 n=1 Tax=Intoshia linei TaxID=1819745 RepID=A0A177B8Q7_9BILA|nr:hypothetical protein A3Q56_01600 [Intoshia linei]